MSATYIHTEKDSKLFRWFSRFAALGYWLAVAAVLAYLWVLACNQYESVGTFRVAREEGGATEMSFAQMIVPGLSDSAAADAQLAIGYINSSDLLLELEKEFQLQEHFSKPVKDRVFRLEPDAPLEERLEFYRTQISTHFNAETSQTDLRVRTFDPELSQKVARTAMNMAETFVNEVNQEVADQQLAFVRAELNRAVEHVNEVNEEILAFQNEHNLIDPEMAITSANSVVNMLQSKRIEKESELATLLRDAPESPKIQNLRSELRSIQEITEIEMAKLSGEEQNRLNQILIDFRALQQKLELANQLRTSAEVLFEQKRIEAAANTRFFSVVQTPYLPEEEAFPQRKYASGVILVLGGLGYLVLRAIVRSILDRN